MWAPTSASRSGYRLGDEQTEDAPAPRQVADDAVGVRIDPGRDEVGQVLPGLIEDSDRGEMGAGQLAGHIEQPSEDAFQFTLCDD